MPLSWKNSLGLVTLLRLIALYRRMAALLALVWLNSALITASAGTPSSAPASGQRFVPFVAGIWETLPQAGGAPQSACVELRPDGTGTMVLMLNLPAGTRTVVSRITWTVAAGTSPDETLLRIRHIRSTEPALNPGPTTESTILEANQLTLKTQTRREEPQTFVRRERMPPEISALIAKANLPATTTQDIPTSP